MSLPSPTPPNPTLQEQLDHLQARLADLQAEAQAQGEQFASLLRHLTTPAPNALEKQVATLAEQADHLQAQVEALSNQVGKLARTQFKANTLAESQEQKVAAALATLQEIVTRREARQDEGEIQRVEQLTRARAEARRALIVELLPVLDGVEAAYQSGQALQARWAARPPAPPTLWDQLRAAWVGTERGSVEMTEPEGARALAAWLSGLTLIRERFLALLAAEGIQPIPALDHPFDPHRHVAVEAVERADVPAGTVVALFRPGYQQGERVLRYAEVAVAQGNNSSKKGEG